ncbi:MAG TPA: MBL fold metallo-hydrolase [Aestuariivirga sp.]|nr:MBL fold metallo-hydrolase [Aestuariivirga sp.]
MAATTGISANRLATVSRRRLMALAGGAALSQWLPRSALAASFGVGDGEISVISDGMLTLPLSFVLPDTPEAEIEALFKANGMSMDSLTPDCNVTLLRKGERLILFDVGSGSNFMPTAGKLSEGLAEAGIDPAEVTDVIFTHAHPDHLWGVLDDFDELVFPNAAYRMAKSEWDFWRDPATIDKLPDARKSFAVGAQTRMAAIEDRIGLFAAGEEVAPGVEAVGTPGHTPGHTSFMVHGGSEPVLIVGDAISNAVISFQKPDWHSGTDQDPEQGAATRKNLLSRLATDRPRIIGYHLPHPGTGRVEARDQVFRFVAEI